MESGSETDGSSRPFSPKSLLRTSQDDASLTQSQKIQRDLKEIMRYLTQLHNDHQVQFLLATKEPDPGTHLKVSHSRIVDADQRKRIIDVIKNVSAETYPSNTPPTTATQFNLCVIRPALKKTETITLVRNRADGDTKLIRHYETLLTSLSQSHCKTIAKEWIKVAEPKKQALFPYKFFNSSKPPWWPQDVNHIEPDHLEKRGRIILLTSILRNATIDLETLRERTKVPFADKPPARRVLDELYYFAAYDRLFYSHHHTEWQYRLLQKIPPDEASLLKGDSISLEGSEMLAVSASGNGFVWMVSKISPDEFNDQAYPLRTGIDPFEPPIAQSTPLANSSLRSFPSQDADSSECEDGDDDYWVETRKRPPPNDENHVSRREKRKRTRKRLSR